ncbi:competence type IV pilus assembly protein ComGB [Streptococcus rupicaprae]|uniref:competence type IV pilus assembly protein ComGB n=1 Tax=Streptococcus rupicaprae TaxID=759619 RepID=UPI0033943BA7
MLKPTSQVGGTKRWISFLKQDISLKSNGKPKKLGLLRQKKIIALFNNLFTSGFNLTEIVSFLRRSQLLADPYTQAMQDGLLSGQSFAVIMKHLGFSDQVVTQLSLAEMHGNLSLCLSKVEAYLGQVLKVKKKLIEVATYPLILVGFLVVLMLGLKNYLLPQLTQGNLATVLVGHFPVLFLGFFCTTLLAILGFRFWLKRTRQLPIYSRMARLPGFGSLLRLYLTGYYAREWGNLIGQGLEMTQILQIMVDQPSRLFSEIGQDMLESLSQGQPFHQKVQDYPFFERELSLIIEYGEAKSKLGQELEIYASDCWDRFFFSINKRMQLIQPLIFIFVALVIVLIYAAMLLPIYHNMEVHL